MVGLKNQGVWGVGVGETHPSSYNEQYGTFSFRKNVHTSAYPQLMIGLIRTNAGQPESVGFLNVNFDTKTKKELSVSRRTRTPRGTALLINRDR